MTRHREPSPETLDRFEAAFKRWMNDGCPPRFHGQGRVNPGRFLRGFDPRRVQGEKKREARA